MKTIKALSPKLGILFSDIVAGQKGLTNEIINSGNGIDSFVLYRPDTQIKEIMVDC